MGSLGDIHQLSEKHQFVLLLLAQVTFLVTQIFLYKSAPHVKKDASDGSALPNQPGNSGSQPGN